MTDERPDAAKRAAKTISTEVVEWMPDDEMIPSSMIEEKIRDECRNLFRAEQNADGVAGAIVDLLPSGCRLSIDAKEIAALIRQGRTEASHE